MDGGLSETTEKRKSFHPIQAFQIRFGINYIKTFCVDFFDALPLIFPATQSPPLGYLTQRMFYNRGFEVNKTLKGRMLPFTGSVP